MAYYLRLFTKRHELATVRSIFDALEARIGFKPSIGLEPGATETDWRLIQVLTESGSEVCLIEQDARDGDDGMFEEEIAEFQELLEDSLPQRGARWASQYIGGAERVYAVRFLEAGFDDVSPSPNDVIWAIKDVVGGIIQADDEGISNEDGYTVVWHFAEDVSGPWNFAVLGEEGGWRLVSFDLSDRDKQQAFQGGTL